MSFEFRNFDDAADFSERKIRNMGWLEKCSDGIYRPQRTITFVPRIVNILENKSGEQGK